MSLVRVCAATCWRLAALRGTCRSLTTTPELRTIGQTSDSPHDVEQGPSLSDLVQPGRTREAAGNFSAGARQYISFSQAARRTKSWDVCGLRAYCRREGRKSIKKRILETRQFDDLRRAANDVAEFNREHSREISVELNGRTAVFRSYFDTPSSVASALDCPGASDAVCAKFGGELIDWNAPLQCSGKMELVSASSSEAVAALNNLGAVLLNMALERAWFNAKLLQTGVEEDGRFYCDITRKADRQLGPAPDVRTLAFLEGYMLATASQPSFRCELLRIAHAGGAEAIGVLFRDFFAQSSPRRYTDLERVLESADLSGRAVYLLDKYVNIHSAPVAPDPSVIKAVAIESVDELEKDDSTRQSVWRFTGRVFADAGEFHYWLETSGKGTLDRQNPLCIHAHWEHLDRGDQNLLAVYRHQDERPPAPDVFEEDTPTDAGDDMPDHYRPVEFSVLHNSYIVLAHPLRHCKPPSMDAMEQLLHDHPDVFPHESGFTASALCNQWSVLREMEELRQAGQANERLFDRRRALITKLSDYSRMPKLNRATPAATPTRKPRAPPLSETISLD